MTLQDKLIILYKFTGDFDIKKGSEPTWDKIFLAVERIHKDYIFMGYRNRQDVLYTIQFLLGGGFKLGRNEKPLEKIPFNKENLFERVIMAIEYYKDKKPNYV